MGLVVQALLWLVTSPFLLVLFVTHYRWKHMVNKMRLYGGSYPQTVVLKQFGWVLLDLPFLVCLIIIGVLLHRIPYTLRGWKQARTGTSRRWLLLWAALQSVLPCFICAVKEAREDCLDCLCCRRNSAPGDQEMQSAARATRSEDPEARSAVPMSEERRMQMVYTEEDGPRAKRKKEKAAKQQQQQQKKKEQQTSSSKSLFGLSRSSSASTSSKPGVGKQTDKFQQLDEDEDEDEDLEADLGALHPAQVRTQGLATVHSQSSSHKCTGAEGGIKAEGNAGADDDLEGDLEELEL